LADCPGYGARIMLELRSSPVDVQMFSSLLRYLYTGDLCPHDATIDVNVLRRLGEDFGTPNPLEHDLRYLLETGDYADAALVFTSESNTSGGGGSNGGASSSGECHRPDSGSSEYGFRPKLELPCHKAILSARSPFFRGMIQRRLRSFEEQNDRATRIVLDETVIPKRYARVLLHAIYLDTVDLSLIIRNNSNGSAPHGSLSECSSQGASTSSASASNSRQRGSPLEEAMELYQIGRFLELDILSQGCEDLILEWLTLDSLPMVLKWGSQPHGSSWVYRQACHYLREEFSAIAVSPILHQLEKSQLIDALQSNFLQASELEILGAVLRWGEHELIRRMEDREPNLLSHTAHSVTRKGIKKRDLSDIELREILSELLPHVRMDHVLPPNNEQLHSAIRRGLVSTPPSHMIGDDRENLRINAWIRGGKNHGLFVRPRLFIPYYDEIKSLLEDHNASQQIELLRLRRSRHYPDIPDTLYMVSRLNRCSVGNVNSSNNDLLSVSPSMTAAQQLDVVNQTSTSSIPAPDSSSMQAMQKREQKLRQTPMCQRALALTLSSKHEIYRQIRLRVVREFNFPDEVSILLENAVSCFCNDDLKIDAGDDSAADDEIMITGPSSPMASNENIPEALGAAQSTTGYYGSSLSFPRVQQHASSNASASGSYRPSLVTDDENYNEDGGVDIIGGHMSMIMPDVTASLGQMTIGSGPPSENIESLHLDLGDGSSHVISTQPRSAQSMHLYGSHSSFIPTASSVAAAQSRLSSSVGNYHHYMTRYMASASSSSASNPQVTPLAQQQQPQQPQPSSSSTHHLSNQVPSSSSPYGIINRRVGEGSSSFRSSSSHSHSSSFL
jgi:BTB/POZ domain-containing protein 7